MNGIDYQGIAILIAAFAAAFVSIGTFIRAGRTDKRIDKLEVNTNSIKDALVKAVGDREFARGGREEREKQTALEGTRAIATITERDRVEAGVALPLPEKLAVVSGNLTLKK